jgi:hypothetical protein
MSASLLSEINPAASRVLSPPSVKLYIHGTASKPLYMYGFGTPFFKMLNSSLMWPFLFPLSQNVPDTVYVLCCFFWPKRPHVRIASTRPAASVPFKNSHKLWTSASLSLNLQSVPDPQNVCFSSLPTFKPHKMLISSTMFLSGFCLKVCCSGCMFGFSTVHL